MNISIYLNKPLLGRVRQYAKHKNLSLSKCISQILEQATESDIPSVPLKKLESSQAMVSFGGDALADTETYYA